jgi:hypothetical protein
MNTLSFRLPTRQDNHVDLGNTHRPKHYLYRAMIKARSLYSNRIAHAEPRKFFQKNALLFRTSPLETQHLEALLRSGFFHAPGFFSKELIDRIYTRAEALFHNLQIEWRHRLSIHTLQPLLKGFSYGDLADERVVELSDPLINIPEVMDIAFHESILKIVANFFRCVPSRYRVAVVRTFPPTGMAPVNDFRQDSDESDSLQIFIDLMDIDEAHGPLIYVPGSNLCGSYRASQLRDSQFPINNRPLGDSEVARVYSRDRWITLVGERGTMGAIHGKGIHSGPAWKQANAASNKPRTSILIEACGYKSGVQRETTENRMRRWNFDRMSGLQQLFAHANLASGEAADLARTG